MDKNDIKDVIQKAKSGAEEGLKKAGIVAKKAASGVNDGLDTAKQSLKKAALAKDALREIQDCIKELEEENKIRTYVSAYEETQVLIGQLKGLSKIIKKDPEKCDNDIDLLADECRVRLKELRESDVIGKELQKVQVLSKHYEDAVMSCLKAKTALETARRKIRQWYIIRNDSTEDLEKSQTAIDAAVECGIECAHVISGAGDISVVGAYCNNEELIQLVEKLGMELDDVEVADRGESKHFEQNLIKQQ